MTEELFMYIESTDSAKSRLSDTLEVMRGEAEWQRAAAYSVRIQGMNVQHHIPLREEIDEHDCDGTRYINLLDEGYPVATCRFYEVGEGIVSLGRVVVLPEYRGKGLGRKVISEAEKWILELGYRIIEIDSRVEARGFYQKLGFVVTGEQEYQNSVFSCIHMEKRLDK